MWLPAGTLKMAGSPQAVSFRTSTHVSSSFVAARIAVASLRIEEAGARAEWSGVVRRRDAAGLDVAAMSQAAELPAPRRIGLSLLEPGDVRDPQRFGERGLVVAGVI